MTMWATLTEDLPCLLDVGTASLPEPTYNAQQQQAYDRAGTLFTLPTADVKPGDRVVLDARPVRDLPREAGPGDRLDADRTAPP